MHEDREIGSYFKRNDRMFEVVVDNTESCEKCSLKTECLNGTKKQYETGHCTKTFRNDSINVSFRESFNYLPSVLNSKNEEV